MAVPTRAMRRHAGALLLLVLLAGCGGGGGSSNGSSATNGGSGDGGGSTVSADVVDKYQGTWGGCFADSGGGTGSNQDRLTLTKTSATTMSFTFTGTHFATTNCTGPSNGNDSGSGLATFVGTKTIGSETVDKVDIAETGQPVTKHVLVIRADGKMYEGLDAGDGGTLDAEGYPTTLRTQGESKLS